MLRSNSAELIPTTGLRRGTQYQELFPSTFMKGSFIFQSTTQPSQKSIVVPAMANFGAYPPNMAPQDALVVSARSHGRSRGRTIFRRRVDAAKGRAGKPFPRPQLAGEPETSAHGPCRGDIYQRAHLPNQASRVERGGGPSREQLSGTELKEQAAQLRSSREKKGDATIAEGTNAYVGP